MELKKLKSLFKATSRRKRRVSAKKIRANEKVDRLYLFASTKYFFEIHDDGYIIASDPLDVIENQDGKSDFRSTAFHVSQVEWIDDSTRKNFTNELDQMDFMKALDAFSYKRFQHNTESNLLERESSFDEIELIEGIHNYHLTEPAEFDEVCEEMTSIAHDILYKNVASLTAQQLIDIRCIFLDGMSKIDVAKTTHRSNTTVHDSYRAALRKITKYFINLGYEDFLFQHYKNKKLK